MVLGVAQGQVATDQLGMRSRAVHLLEEAHLEW